MIPNQINLPRISHELAGCQRRAQECPEEKGQEVAPGAAAMVKQALREGKCH